MCAVRGNSCGAEIAPVGKLDVSQFQGGLTTMKATPLDSLPEPTEAEIQHAAYLLWLENGQPEGRDRENWFAAKELLRHRHAPPAPNRRASHTLPFVSSGA